MLFDKNKWVVGYKLDNDYVESVTMSKDMAVITALDSFDVGYIRKVKGLFKRTITIDILRHREDYTT